MGLVRHPYIDQAGESFRGLTFSYKVHLWVVVFVSVSALVLRIGRWGSEWASLAGCILVLVTGFLAVFLPYRQQVGPIASTRSLALVGLVGAGVSALNIYFSLPFGKIIFAHSWCPYLLISMWVVVVFGTVILTRKWLHGIGCILGSGILVGLLSILASAAAGAVGFWSWKEAGPLPNNTPMLFPVGWFVISALAAAVIDQSLSHESVEYREPGYVVWLQSGLLLVLLVIYTFIK